MLRRCLFVSVMVLASAISFTSRANAQAEPVSKVVTMSGKVDSGCSLSSAVAGTLTPNSSFTALLTSTPGKIDVECTGAAEISISNVTQDQGDTLTTNSASLTVASNTTTYTSAGTGTPISIGSTGLSKTTANVSLSASNAPNTLTNGTYTYFVEITATPK